MKPLVLFAHPRPDRSEVNTPLFEVARAVAGVTAVDLYAEYSDFNINVDKEQERLLEHDVIIFQHPIYWYSSPALLKEWQDLVLEHGFAYGHEGRALEGKILLNAVSTGAKREAYSPEGAYGAELRDLLLPFQKTAELCRMRYLAPFVLYGAGRASDEGHLKGHLGQYRQFLEALVANQVDLKTAGKVLTINEAFDQITMTEEP